jgi:hypothetical protein
MKSRGLLRAVAFVAAVAAPLAARAQEVNLATLDEGGPNRVYVRTGAEYAFVAGVGYGRVVSLLDRHLILTGDLTAPWAALDASDYRVRAGVTVPIVGSRRWKLAGVAAPTLRGTNNPAGRMTNLGADLGLIGGFYARHWFVAGELGFDWAITTHVNHSDLYRETVYADARDGWYSAPGGNLRAGLQAGASFGRYGLALRVGQVRDVGGAPPMVPFYGTLALETQW